MWRLILLVAIGVFAYPPEALPSEDLEVVYTTNAGSRGPVDTNRSAPNFLHVDLPSLTRWTPVPTLQFPTVAAAAFRASGARPTVPHGELNAERWELAISFEGRSG